MSTQLRQFILFMLLYVGALVLVINLTARLALPLGAEIALALLPLLPAALVVRGVLLSVRTQDELHRRIHQEALTFAFFAHFFLSLTYSLLEIIPLPAPGLGWQIIQMGALAALGGFLARRKYGV